MSNFHNGSDTILVFGTRPSSPSHAWSLENVKILPFETSNAINRNIETEDLETKSGLTVTTAANASTTTSTVFNKVSYEITGSTYVNKAAVEGALTASQLRSVANAGKFEMNTGTSAQPTMSQVYVAVINRPSAAPTETSPTLVQWYDAWAGANGEGVEIVVPVMISNLTENEDVKTHVKMDITLKPTDKPVYVKSDTITA